MKRPRATFSFFTSAAVAALFAASCVVTSGDDDDFVCDEGETRSCRCDDVVGTQTCSTGRTRFDACECDGAGAGGTGGAPGEGGAPSVSGAPSAAGAGATAGEAGAGGTAGAVNGGEGGGAGAAGEGGSAGGGGLCSEPIDSCEDCIFALCCDEYSACLSGTDACQNQLGEALACIDVARENSSLSPSGVASCAAEAAPNMDIDDLDPRTRALLDCMGGSADWPSQSSWPDATSCGNGCFDQLDE